MFRRRLLSTYNPNIEDESNYIIVQYNGKAGNNPTQILGNNFNYISDIKYMYVDGIKKPAAKIYNFGNISNHTIKFILKPIAGNCDDMFRECDTLTSFDLSHFDMSNVISLTNMFFKDVELTNVTLKDLNWSKVTKCNSMFSECSKLKTVTFINVKSPNLTNMSWMFNWTDLTSADLSGLDTSSVTAMNNIFADCWALKTLKIMTPVNKLTNADKMFVRNVFVRGTFYYNKNYNYDVIKTPFLWTRQAV